MQPLSRKQISKLIGLATEKDKAIRYNQHGKLEFAQLSKRYLKDVAKGLGLTPSQYDLNFIASGPAVGGEAVLHSDHLYVAIIGAAIPPLEVLYRSCNGRKDYSGGPNHWARYDDLRDREQFVRTLKKVMDRAVESAQAAAT